MKTWSERFKKPKRRFRYAFTLPKEEMEYLKTAFCDRGASQGISTMIQMYKKYLEEIANGQTTEL